MGPDFRVAGSFATTVARVRGLLPAESQMIPLGIPGETSASLCYLDGPVSHGPPPVNGVVQPSFDRAAVVVVGDAAYLVAAGYQDRLALRDPNAR